MKILIVDDTPGLAAGLAQWLAENGWEAPGVAAGSEEAITWINQSGHVDVLVSEVFLQSSDGFTLRETLEPHFPKMRTIFISGYDLTEHAERMVGCLFLAKPVTGEALDGAIRRLFEPAPMAVTATPRAVAVATPKATPAATPTAVAATPKATPAAIPTAVAATPKATPAATPTAVTATPKATPVAVPTAVAATPKATPVATPTAMPAAPKAAPAAVPTAVAATPKATPAAVPTAVPAAPKATPAVPKAVAAAPKAVAAVPQPVVAAVIPEPVVETPVEDLTGCVIGNYQLEERIGQSSQGLIYRALQTNMGRPVRLYLLDRTRAQDPAEIQRFISNASVKANVSHPQIFAVYEAGEKEGIYFYSCEYVPCRSLRQIREAGEALDEATALQAMKVAAEVLGYFTRDNIAHEMISENAILIGPNNRPRIANIAAYQPTQNSDTPTELSELGRIIAGVLPANSQKLGIRQLAQSLATGDNKNIRSWPALSQAVTALEPKVAPQDAYKLDAQERAAIRMVEEAKKKQKRGMWISSGISLGLLALALFAVWWVIRPKGASVRDLDHMVEIPAGEFIYQDGQTVNLPTFYIDEYEVTIAQYAEFLAYLETHPDEVSKFEHEKQPKGKSHVPEQWADTPTSGQPVLGYYNFAKGWAKFKGEALDVNSPVFGLDWFDAYAYAKWKGRRLPTEQEWEKAARGTNGFKYPWGNEANPKYVNSGVDNDPVGNQKDPRGGEVDGFDRWSPVDAMKKDESPFKVHDMAGNVSEWTATFDVDPQGGNEKIPVIRGGNWQNGKDYSLTRRVRVLPALGNNETLGFRTASDTPPAKK